MSSPCLNGAACADNGSYDQYTCTCPEGFQGKRCQGKRLTVTTNQLTQCIMLSSICPNSLSDSDLGKFYSSPFISDQIVIFFLLFLSSRFPRNWMFCLQEESDTRIRGIEGPTCHSCKVRGTCPCERIQILCSGIEWKVLLWGQSWCELLQVWCYSKGKVCQWSWKARSCVCLHVW